MKVVNGGFKDLTTDEAYALANGLRVIMSSGRTKLQNRGDAQLANKFSEAKNDLGLNNPTHSSSKSLAKEIEVKFTNDDLRQIHEAGPNAGTVLREKLIAKGADEAKLEAEPEALLNRFGFTVTKGADGKISKVSSPEGYTLDTHTRTVDSKNAGNPESIKLDDDDVRTILAGNNDAPERLRTILRDKYHVDPSKINTDDAKLLKEFNFGYRKTTFGKDRGKVSHVYREYGLPARAKSKISPDEQFTRRGYLTDLWNGSNKRRAFIDESMQNDQLRTQIDALMTATGNNTPTRAMQRAYARSQFRIGEQPVRSGNSRFMPNIGSSESNTTSTNTSSNPLPTPRTKQSVVDAMRNNTGFEAYKPKAENTVTETPVQATMDKIHSTPEMTKVSENNSAKRTAKMEQLKQKRIASNIKKIRKSKDPMSTLSQLSEQETKDMIAESRIEFIDAIAESATRLQRKNKSKNQEELNNYLNKLYELFAERFKKGGIIKAQMGDPLPKLNDG